MNNIQKILSNCIKGDELACKKLYQMFLPYCCGICNRYSVQQSDLKDQVQIIFSSMFMSLKNFDATKASFKTWFTRICINKIMEQRRSNRNQMTYDELPEFNSYLVNDDRATLDGQMEVDYIVQILKQMPLQFQSVFNMFIIDEYSHKEIAKALSISEGSSRITLQRAREWAKSALSNYLKYS